jgi:hypothetical protein
MARILWISDCPVRATGFGLVTREICARLATRGHQVRILGWWGVPGPREFGGVQADNLPTDPYRAKQKIEQEITNFYPEFLVSLGDIPWLSYIADPSLNRIRHRPLSTWHPRRHGSMLRQEIYALDEKEESRRPYLPAQIKVSIVRVITRPISWRRSMSCRGERTARGRRFGRDSWRISTTTLGASGPASITAMALRRPTIMTAKPSGCCGSRPCALPTTKD